MGQKTNKVERTNSSIYVPKAPKTIKRLAAWFIDIILIIVVATGVALMTSAIYGYDSYNNKCYQKEIEYGIYVEDPKGELSFEDKTYTICYEVEGITKEEASTRYEKLYQDSEYREAYSKRSIGQVIIITTAIVISITIFELIVPLILKHGRTIGMKFFDIGYVTDEGIDVGVKEVFIRFLFGKLVVGALIPYSGIMLSFLMPTQYTIVGFVAIFGVIGINLLLLFTTPEKRGIHDFIAKCVPCDNSCQIYFKTIEELSKAKAEDERIKNEKKYY
jgi:uncharacterized RDD family membrane protein YckC